MVLTEEEVVRWGVRIGGEVSAPVFLGLKGGHFERVCKIIDRELGRSCGGLSTSKAHQEPDPVPSSN